MKLPSAEQYLQIIENKAPGSFAMLQSHQFASKQDGTPIFIKGRNAIVFKTASYSNLYAIRFFLNDEQELFERYLQLQEYLGPKTFSWKLPFEFLDKEYYPAVKMDWIDSLSFTEYLDLIINEPSRISRLQYDLAALSHHLEKNKIGHGNLNLKHIRFVKQEQKYVLKLIDYDAMFIPAFEGKDSLSAGTANFQHPIRLASDFSESVDRFSFWVFLTALEAFKTDASLWTGAAENGYDKSQQILFSFRDLAFPQQSRVFQILKVYNKDALNFYVDKLMTFCNAKSLNDIEAPQIYGQTKSDPVKEENSNSSGEKRTARMDPKQNEKEQTNTIYVSKPPEKKRIVPEEPVLTKTAVIEKNTERIHLKFQSEHLQQEHPSSRKKKTTRTAVIIVSAILLLFTSVYFVSRSHSVVKQPENKPSSEEQAMVTEKQFTPVQQSFSPKETVFTDANASQFLLQLYQSYNNRDLQSIVSNYADTVEYYDAGALPKDQLTKVIRNLFIQPFSYECHPDFRTFQLNVQGDTCQLTITVNETVRTDKNASTQNYSSKIVYTIDRSFKIHTEKRAD